MASHLQRLSARTARNGIDPAWFGTNVTVRDLESVRRALGVGRWNIYARSSEPRVAMTLVALYIRRPARSRSRFRYPPDPLPLTRTQTFDAALDALFQACRSDPSMRRRASRSCHDVS